jgi:hypothetical protein
VPPSPLPAFQTRLEESVSLSVSLSLPLCLNHSPLSVSPSLCPPAQGLEDNRELHDLLPVLQRGVSLEESCDDNSGTKKGEDIFWSSRATDEESDGGTEQDSDVDTLQRRQGEDQARRRRTGGEGRGCTKSVLRPHTMRVM